MKAMARKHMAVRAALLRVTMSLALAVGFFGAMLVSGTQRDNAEAAPALTDAVWRVQIQFQTGSEPGAGTDDNVAVSLNPQSVTVIDSPINDFEYQQSGTYDLKFRGATGGAATFNDLQYVTVGHRGDPWCLRSYSVIVNNAWAFYKSFSGEPDYCKWLGDGQAWSTTRRQWVAVPATVSAASTEIRSGGFWFYYAQPRLTFPMTIGRAELTKRAEMAVGDMMRAIWTSYGWGNDQRQRHRSDERAAHLAGRGLHAQRWLTMPGRHAYPDPRTHAPDGEQLAGRRPAERGSIRDLCAEL